MLSSKQVPETCWPCWLSWLRLGQWRASSWRELDNSEIIGSEKMIVVIWDSKSVIYMYVDRWKSCNASIIKTISKPNCVCLKRHVLPSHYMWLDIFSVIPYLTKDAKSSGFPQYQQHGAGQSHWPRFLFCKNKKVFSYWAHSVRLYQGQTHKNWNIFVTFFITIMS